MIDAIIITFNLCSATVKLYTIATIVQKRSAQGVKLHWKVQNHKFRKW